MRTTGIIRRFDDLGRIVIPKELRKQLFGTPEKSEGMPMEIFMDKDDIILRKYEADDVCEWKTNDNQHMFAMWETECGARTMIQKLPSYKYCPYCGKRIKVVY